ncbi:hypothetical protein CHUAL_005237 [Chamberlinius hualienensis]
MVIVTSATSTPSSVVVINGSSKMDSCEDEKVKTDIIEEDSENDDSLESDDEEMAKKNDPPEGGWGWVVVLGVFVVYWLVPGMIRSYGALYMEVLEAFPESSASTAGWIPAFLSSISIGLAPISAVLGKLYTCRNVVFVGGCLCSIGLISSYFATSIFYLFISFGLVTGIGAGLCTTPSVIVINSYFNKKRALASALCQSGAAIGSFTLPLFVKILVNEYNLRGALLIMGGIVLNVCAVSLLFTQDGKWYSKPNKKKQLKKTAKVNGNAIGNGASITRTLVPPKSAPTIRSNTKINESADQNLKEALLGSKPVLLAPSNRRTGSLLYYPNSLAVATSMPRSASFAVQAPPAGDREVRQMSSSFSYSIHDLSTASVFVSHPTSLRSSVRSITDAQRNDLVDGKNEEIKPTVWEHIKEFLKMCLDFTLFKEATYVVTVVAATFISGGFPQVLFFVPVFAHTLGIDKVDASLLVSICSGVDLVGRIAYGWFMDLRLIKRSNGLAITCAICAIGNFMHTTVNIICHVGCIYNIIRNWLWLFVYASTGHTG